MSMRTKILGGLAATCMLVAPAAFGGVIAASAHDFSGTGWGDGEICKACHAPHNNVDKTGLLWNHTQSSVTTYTLYSSTTMQSTPGQPGGTSKLCMSCHDGTVALDSYGGHTTGTGGPLTGAANFGTNLQNDHPISITWPTADTEIKPTTSTFAFGTGPAGTIADVLDGGATGTMECQSCHDVHNTRTADGTPLLLRANTASGLCLTCHTK